MKPPTITGAPVVGPLIPMPGEWDGSSKVYEKTTLTVRGVVIASVLGNGCVIPASANGKSLRVHSIFSREPLVPDEIGTRLKARRR